MEDANIYSDDDGIHKVSTFRIKKNSLDWQSIEFNKTIDYRPSGKIFQSISPVKLAT